MRVSGLFIKEVKLFIEFGRVVDRQGIIDCVIKLRFGKVRVVGFVMLNNIWV